jgi:DNA-binding MarR family transcriptional regulator
MTIRRLNNAPATGAVDERDRLRAVAQRYREQFEWADTDAIEISMAILRMGRLIAAASQRNIDALNLGAAMTDARFTLLVTLYFTKDRRLAQNEISRELGVSRTNITNLIDGLERDGLVKRIANPADRRVSHAQLTPEGEQLCSVLLPIMTRFLEQLCAGFSDDEKVRLRDYLRRFRHDLRERYLPDPPPEADTE